MAVITSTATGLYGTGGTWVGGIAPVEGDSVVIAIGHVVTVDGTYTAGDDTTTAFTVNGTLKASRTVNSSLTVKGQLLTAATTTATIDYGRRSTTDPIPAGVTAALILNKSAAMVSFKYGLFLGESSNAYFCGATRVPNARITNSVAAGGTSADVDDITGWIVGDTVVMASSDGTYNHHDSKVIATITPGAGTTGTITFTATTYAHASNCPIGNRTSNVTIKNFNTSTYTFVCNRFVSATTNSRREYDYITFEYCGSNSSLNTSQVFVSSSTNSTIYAPFVTVTNNFFYNCSTTTACLFINAWNAGTFAFENLGFFSDTGTGSHWYTASGTVIELKNSVFYYSTGLNIQSGFSQGGQGCKYTDVTFCATSRATMVLWTNGDGGVFTRCGFHTVFTGSSYYTDINCGSGTFTNCNFGNVGTITGSTPVLWGTPVSPYIVSVSVAGSKGDWTMNDCYFGTPGTAFGLNIAIANTQWILRVANKNLDPLVQEIYTPNGNIVRDNTSKVSGVQSLKMSPTSASNALTFTLSIPAPTGKMIGVSGFLWRDTANVTTVTLSGLGITPSVYTASGSLSANEQFFVSGAQTSGTDGILTLTVSTIGTTGILWVDGISAPQAIAIDFGEFGFWSGGLPVSLITASYVSAGDVWNYLLTNITVTGSIGTFVKKLLSVAKFLGLK